MAYIHQSNYIATRRCEVRVVNSSSDQVLLNSGGCGFLL